jgi:hypothetical protein
MVFGVGGGASHAAGRKGARQRAVADLSNLWGIRACVGMSWCLAMLRESWFATTRWLENLLLEEETYSK